jgi:NADH-quinone oxidoreductase subunit C
VTVALNSEQVAKKINEAYPGAAAVADRAGVIVNSDSLFQAAEFLKKTAEFDFNYLGDLTAVDYTDYFEVVYRLVSLEYNHSLVLKTRCYDRDNPAVPSVTKIWRAANFMEREVYDLMGIVFMGHPNLKRLFMWEGFEGHPLRRDYL